MAIGTGTAGKVITQVARSLQKWPEFVQQAGVDEIKMHRIALD